MLRLHPDRNPSNTNPNSKEKDTSEFLKCVKSWELLSDPEKRRAYDFDAARGHTDAYAREARGRSRNGGDVYESWDDPRVHKKSKARRTG